MEMDLLEQLYAQAKKEDGCKMGVTPGWIMAAAGSLGGIACVLFLVSTIGRFRRQRKTSSGRNQYGVEKIKQ